MRLSGSWRARSAASALLFGVAGACAVGPAAPEPVAAPQPPQASLYSTSGNAALDAWRDAFHVRAVAEGFSADLVRSVLADVKPLEIYLPSTPSAARAGLQDQAEFSKPIWDYVDDVVSETRKSRGIAQTRRNAGLLEAIEARYGVDGESVAAIWGVETSYGGYIGDFDGPETFANMAAEGRRRAFAEGELLAILKILEGGYAARDDLIAGWAGAMGQTQFIPSTYLAHAVDWTGDGRRDVWTSEGDALASAANYLSVSGYAKDQPWSIEVIAASGFDYSLADGQRRTIAEWRAAGLAPLRTNQFETGGADSAELWLPAGALGPKLLMFDNFDVFKVYNRSDSYALAVGLLSDVLAGRPGLATPWPRDAELLSLDDVRILQARLNDMGYNAGPVDGIAGRGTRRALQRFQKDNGLLADGFPTRAALDAVMSGA